MIQRHEVQVLLDAGFSHRQVSKKTGVSKRSVTRIAQEADVETLDLRSRPNHPGRPSIVSRHEQLLDKILVEEPGLLSVEILHRLKQAGYAGGKSAGYDFIRARRGPAAAAVMVRFEGVAGEFAQFDFGEV